MAAKAFTFSHFLFGLDWRLDLFLDWSTGFLVGGRHRPLGEAKPWMEEGQPTKQKA